MREVKLTKNMKKKISCDFSFRKSKQLFLDDLKKIAEKNIPLKPTDLNLTINSTAEFVPNCFSTPLKDKTATKVNNDYTKVEKKKCDIKLSFSKNKGNISTSINCGMMKRVNNALTEDDECNILSTSHKIRKIVGNFLSYKNVLNGGFEIEDALNPKFNIEESQSSYTSNEKFAFSISNLSTFSDDMKLIERNTKNTNVEKSTQTTLSFERNDSDDEIQLTYTACKSSTLLIPKHEVTPFVKRLIIGISIYGCNFQKISTTLWSSKERPSPKVLYNVFRKLIVKA